MLVVSQDAERGRHQLLLLQLLRHLAAEGVPASLVLWEGGPLLGEMRDACPDVVVVDELHEWKPGRLLQRLGRHREADGLKGLRLRHRLRRRPHPFVYVHGGRPARLVGYLDARRPVVLHLPELEPGADVAAVRSAVGVDADLVLGRADGIVVAHADVAAVVATAASLASSQVAVVPTYGDRRAGRQALGVPAGATVLAAVGTGDWWRAPDQVVPLLWLLRKRLPDLGLRLRWLCAEDDPDGLWPLRHDLATAGLADVADVVVTTNPLDELLAADAVVAVGRGADLVPLLDDLVLAERPVVVSDEVAARHLGAQALLVPYLDLEAAVDALATALRAGPGPAQPGRTDSDGGGAAHLVEAVRRLAAPPDPEPTVAPASSPTAGAS
jgi:hypothetical protein